MRGQRSGEAYSLNRFNLCDMTTAGVQITKATC